MSEDIFCGISLDPCEIAKGLRDGTIRLTTADDAARTPLVNAYLREVEKTLAAHHEHK